MGFRHTGHACSFKAIAKRPARTGARRDACVIVGTGELRMSEESRVSAYVRAQYNGIYGVFASRTRRGETVILGTVTRKQCHSGALQGAGACRIASCVAWYAEDRDSSTVGPE